MIVGCYTLNLYCKNETDKFFYDSKGDYVDIFGHFYNEFPHQYVDQLGSTCRKKARKDGWIIRKGIATCPKCSNKKL